MAHPPSLVGSVQVETVSVPVSVEAAVGAAASWAQGLGAVHSESRLAGRPCQRSSRHNCENRDHCQYQAPNPAGYAVERHRSCRPME